VRRFFVPFYFLLRALTSSELSSISVNRISLIISYYTTFFLKYNFLRGEAATYFSAGVISVVLKLKPTAVILFVIFNFSLHILLLYDWL